MKLQEMGNGQKPSILRTLKGEIKASLAQEKVVLKRMEGLTGEEKRKIMGDLERRRGMTEGLRKAYRLIEMFGINP